MTNKLSSVVKAMADVGRSLRQDGWRSTLTGIGGRRDKANSVRFCPTIYLDRETLAGVYRDSWLVRRIVTAVPEEALRRGFGEDAEFEEFERLNFERYPGEGALIRACNLARLMGGSMIYLGFKDGGADLTMPAREGAEVAFLEVFHRFEVQGVESSRVLDPADPMFGRPQLWEVIGRNRTGLRFHASRAIIFPGQPRADNFETVAGTDRDWDDSVLQAMWEDVSRYGLFWQSVSHLMQISSVGVLKIAGLIDMLTRDNQADAEARIDLLNEALSITRLMMLDAEKAEEYHREAVSFADVPALLQELQQATAGAVEMPVTVLFGRAPAGLNATGDSDLRLWYDTVDTWRERVLTPRAEALISACERKPVDIEWPALWEPTEKECAEVKMLETTRQERLWSMGVASDAEIRQALFERKPIEDFLSGPPAAAEPTPAVTQIAVDPEAEDEPPPTDPADDYASIFEDPADDIFDDADFRQDATAADVERRLAIRVLRKLREDPDVLGEVAGLDGDVADVRAHLIQRAKEMLPALSDVEGERRALVKEVRQLKTFKAEIAKELPDLAKAGAQHHAENQRRAAHETVDDPDKVNPIRLPGDKTGAATYLENKRREKEGKSILQGPRGGRYYISVGGSKTYV